MRVGEWAIVLQGELAERAAQAVDDIAGDLQEIVRTGTGFLPEHGHSSLSSGWPGLALFFAYLHRIKPEEGYDDLAFDLLERALAGIQTAGTFPGLFSGFPGVAWVLEHLQGVLFDVEGDDPGEEAAKVLEDYLRESPGSWGPGLLGGLTGLGVYALERLPRPGGLACLKGVTAQLAKSAEQLPEGIAWRTLPEDSLEEARERFPRGHYNVGTALGAPGIAVLLAGACTVGLESHRLLEGTVAWILAQELPPGGDSMFPFATAPEGIIVGRQLAWCYGDLGIATSLFLAAQAVGEPHWTSEALRIARNCVSRPIESLNAKEGNLCHGTAGVAHLFNRFFQATGDLLFKDAALAWFERTLEVRRPGHAVGGFPSLNKSPGSGKAFWEINPGLQGGAAGVGLALLAALSPVEPEWDRLILASLRFSAPWESRLLEA